MRRTSRILVTALAVAGCTVAPARAASSRVPTLAGCPLFPADNAWRRDISQLRVSKHSAQWVRSVGRAGHLHPDFGANPSYGIPYETVPKRQKRVKITFTAYGAESDPGPYPIPARARIESGGDRHVLVASRNCHIYELYGARRSGKGWKADSGAVFDLRSNKLRPNGWTSADAAGLPILPGLLRWNEVKAGDVDHAIRFTTDVSSTHHLWPARHAAGSKSSQSYPPMGARFRLKAGFSTQGFSPYAVTVIRAMKTYGLVLADNGSSWYFQGEQNAQWPERLIGDLKRIPASAFVAVDTSSLKVSNDSAQVSSD
jgi:hypothetical protein